MTKIEEVGILLLSCIFLFSGHGNISAFSYQSSETSKCLAAPESAEYGGGIIVNPEFDEGTAGWTVSGKAEIREGVSEEGNKFVIVRNRTGSLDSLMQATWLTKENIYTFSAWVQVSEGSEVISVVFKNNSNGKLMSGGETVAKHGCWSLLKGGIVANASSPVHILLESKNDNVEMWVDSVSLQPFTAKQWRSQQDKNIEKFRKSKVRFQVTYANKTAANGAILSLVQTTSAFPFGCGMNHHILTSTGYQDWFASRFKLTSFTNEMKWYSTEKVRAEENYTIADAMVEFSQRNGISIRGHNILWDNPKMQPEWVHELSSPDELLNATMERVYSVVSRYAGQLIGWDVMNENLHFSFFEDKLGEDASSFFYSMAYHLEPNTTFFMNEYNTIEYSQDQACTPFKYREKLEQIMSYPGNEGMKAAIGMEGHFTATQPNIACMKSVMDDLATIGLPIWLTEVDIGKGPNQAQYLEDILREGYSHPAVEGIIIFGGPEVAGFDVMTLADSEFSATHVGDVVDNLISEWKSGIIQITTNNKGLSEASLFHGDYNVTVHHPVTNSSTTINFKITKEIENNTVFVQIDA